jgi:hypothetical protein
MSKPQDHSAADRIRSIENLNEVIENRTFDLQACSTVPQATAVPRDPKPENLPLGIKNLSEYINKFKYSLKKFLQVGSLYFR